ncbi:MAG: isoprenylcysteine carboxylmethyltransferase family protein [Armatimonadetes bacterium]|nr:isoprenylcysteine carboxylmethyltransferase family protein [Armatimonadota bacterium]
MTMTTHTQSQTPAPASRPPFLVRRRTVFTWVVPLLLLIAVLMLRPQGGHAAWLAGVALVALGEIVRFWAAGYISKDAAIATGGPYAFVRNPLYFGSLLLSVGYGLVSGFGWAGVLVLVALYLVFHLAAIFYEEKFLKAKFGQPYLDYLHRVPRLIPSPWPRTDGPGGFSWAQALKNREHISALFALIFVALLSLRFLVH